MKFSYITAIGVLAVLGVISCNSDERDKTKRQQEKTTASAETVLPEKCYKRLEGSIAGQPVVMHLQRAGERFNTIYYYKNQGRWITLQYIADSSSKDRLFFYEYVEGNLDMNGTEAPLAKLICRYIGGALTGTWISGDGARRYDFRLNETYPEGSYRFTVFSFADSVIAFDSKPDGPAGKISEYFIMPEGDGEDASWLTTQMKKVLYLDSSYRALGIEEAIKRTNAAYLASYKNDVKDMEQEEFMATLNYESMQEVSVRYNERGYVVLESLAYDYSGGAHGNHGSALYCLDVTGRKQLALQDIISADSNQLRPLLERHFRSQAGLAASQPLTEYLFENRLMPNDNFYFTDKGIGFVYNPYEIAAYAMGQINIFIPFTDLKPYIRPGFAERMNLQR